jgi:hypothetical protein
MDPIVLMSPPETLFTSQVTVVVVETVEFDRFTTAVNVVCVFSGTVIEVGEIVTLVTVVEPLPPPQLDRTQPAAIVSETIASRRAIECGERCGT